MNRNQLQQVSQLFFWGFDGTRITRELKQALQLYPPAGLILFKRNIESPAQLKRLTASLQKLSQTPLLIGIDQEGGRVSRLPEPFIQYPPAAIWGELYQKNKTGTEWLRRIGRFMGRELRSTGINLDFAPVLDVNSNPKNPIIGDRAFARQPTVVIQTALPFAQGLLEGGVIPCGKHFPGHGDTQTDSHLTLPRVNRPLSSLKRIELPPFRTAIRARIPMLMTAHVVYRALDPNCPATLSEKILSGLLRRQLGFKGVIISDDLQMKAISAQYSLLEASCRSLNAGVDLLLICKDFEKAGQLVAKMAAEIGRSPALQTRLRESLQRIKRLKTKIPEMRG